MISKALSAFGRFWWEFLVGDTPELLLAVLVIVGAALALKHHAGVADWLLPVLVAISLGLSAYRGRRRENAESAS